jgi:SAM-dependent methyltransferase
MCERFPDIDVQEAGADALPYPDGVFDAVLAQLVVHFLENPVAGLHEMRRVTRAGGFVTACVWDFAGHRGPLGPFWDAARSISPDVDDESARAGTREGHLVELFELAGLTEVVGVPLPITLAFADFDDWWDPFTFGVGPAGQLVASLDADDQARLRDRCRRALPDGAFELSAVAWGARGVA